MPIEAVAALQGHTDRAWSLSWHPTQPLLASCSGDKSVRLAIFRLNNAQSISFVQSTSVALPLTHTRTVRNLAWNPKNNMLATASFDSTVGLWESMPEQGIDDGEATQAVLDLESYDCVSSLEGHESEVKAVAWNHDGRLLATCGRDKSVWIWEMEPESGEFECLAVLMDHTQDVKSLAWHPKGDILASASYDDTIKIYQADIATDDWSCTHTLPSTSAYKPHFSGLAKDEPERISFGQTGHSSTVWSVAFSPCGRFLASASDDTTIRIWRRIILSPEQLPDKSTVYRIGAADKERWECALLIDGQFERTVYSVDWSLQPSLAGSDSLGCLVAGGSDGKLAILNITDNGDKLQFNTIASIENAHGISDINAVKWCSSRPTQPPSSDQEEESDQEATSTWQSRWANATAGLFGSTGDDGLVRVWKVRI